ncbi:hypothetical protein SFB3_221G1 [Candidatus Arthromitus sp. SFB-3]|nr:hypothetical protein SFB3_221G1 [Candidatus Arthromitus sp. SFB-3]
MVYDEFKSRFILSPMAGVNNIAFREMCVKYHDGINFYRNGEFNGTLL